MSDDNKLEIIVSADTSDAESSFQSLLDYEKAVDDITINATSEGIDDISGQLEAIPDSTETVIDAKESEDAKTAYKNINFMAAIKKIEIILNIAQKGFDIAMDLVNPFLDVQDAVAKVQAQTGATIPGLDKIIEDIKFSDLGESYDQIANVVIAAKQLGAPIDDATRAALTFTHTWKDQDPVTVMTTLNTLAGEFGVTMQEASDLMTVFFQQGGNKGGDAINTINTYSQSWKDMGLTATQALSLVSSLMQNGVDNASDAARMVQTLDDAFTTAANNANSPQAQAIAMLGLKNPKDTGEAIGADTIDGIAAAFDNLPADKQDLVSGLLFGKGGKKFTSAISGMTTESGPFSDYIGAAKDAAAEVDDSLRGSIDDFVLAVNKSLTELLSSDSVDLDGFLNRLKTGFQTAVDILAGGGTIGEALEKGFGIQGFETFIGNFQRVIGELEIAVLKIVREITRATGGSTSSLDEQIKNLSLGQLKFDLQLANPKEMEGMINTAINNGVSEADAGQAIYDSIQETIDKANFGQTLNIFKGIEDSPTATPEQVQAVIDKFTPQLNTAMGNALKSGNFDLASQIGAAMEIPDTTIQAMVDKARTTLSDAFAPKQRTGGVFDASAIIGESISENDPVTQAILDQVQTAQDAFDAVGTHSTDAQATIEAANAASVTAIKTLADAAEEVDTRTGDALTGHTVTTTFETVAASAEENFPIVIHWLDSTISKVLQLDSAAEKLAVIPSILGSIVEGIGKVDTGKLQAIVNAANGVGGGGNTTVNNTTNNVNATQNNHISNNAQAASASYQFAASVRPGAS